jgi:hypothetical protein
MIYNAVMRGMVSLLQLIHSHVYGEGRHGSPDHSCNASLNTFWSSLKPSTDKFNMKVICQYIMQKFQYQFYAN